MKFGNPLLTTEEDNAYVVKTITDVFPVIQDKKTALVLMGHGTEHYANTVYAALDYRFKDMGYTKNIPGNSPLLLGNRLRHWFYRESLCCH